MDKNTNTTEIYKNYPKKFATNSEPGKDVDCSLSVNATLQITCVVGQ